MHSCGPKPDGIGVLTNHMFNMPDSVCERGVHIIGSTVFKQTIYEQSGGEGEEEKAVSCGWRTENFAGRQGPYERSGE